MSSELSPAVNGVSVLVVDDELPMQQLLQNIISPLYDCTIVSSAKEAVDLLAERYFNIVLTDINMPGDSGLELCWFIHNKWPEVPVILVSGLTDIRYAIEALGRGAFDYVTKPFDVAHVLIALDRAIRYHDVVVSKFRYEQRLEASVQMRTSELRSLNESLNFTLEALYTNYRATLRALSGSLEARDVETRGHADRVVAYSLKLAKELGLSQLDIIALEQGALLHDIGKIGVRDSILLKRGPLDAEEWVCMRGHVQHGLRIIDGIDFLEGARPVVGQHHEKYDGSGYPRGLKAEAIHIHARIFAVADAFDAITSDRPYRMGQPYESAASELVRNSGSHFDPVVVKTFLGIGEGEWDDIRAASHRFAEAVVDQQEIRSFIVSLKTRDESQFPTHGVSH